MTIDVLVEALSPGGRSTSHQSPDKGGDDKKDNAKEWIKNQLRALASF